jgi:hypothetical protein
MAYVYRGTLRDIGPERRAEIAKRLREAPVRTQSIPGPKPRYRLFDPSHCGTFRGYKQHEKTGTEKCQPCKDANAAYSRDYEARRKTGQVQTIGRGFRADKCGTYAGYCRHRRHNVPACGPCADASRAHTAQYRANLKAAA